MTSQFLDLFVFLGGDENKTQNVNGWKDGPRWFLGEDGLNPTISASQDDQTLQHVEGN